MLTSLSLHYVLVLSFIWLVLCTVAYWVIPRQGFTLRQRPAVLVTLLIVAVLALRLIPAAVLPVGAGYDIESFRRVAQTFWEGKGVYSSPLVAGRHPYFPLQVYWIAAAMKIANVTGLSFVFTLKWAPILADVGLTVLIFYAFIQRGRSAQMAVMAALLYALNPISIVISAYHGQFDAEPAFLLALAWYLGFSSERSERVLRWSAVVLGFAILNKTWPVFFLPIAFIRLKSWKKILWYGGIAGAVPVIFTVLYLLVFHEDPHPLLGRALTHAGVPGWWGVSVFFSLMQDLAGTDSGVLQSLAQYSRWIVFAGVGMSYWLTRKQSSITALTTALLALYVFTNGFGLQWLLWIVPFALLDGDFRGGNAYVLGGLIYMLPSYYGCHLDETLAHLLTFERMVIIMKVSAIPAWLISVGWLFRRLSRLRIAARTDARA